MKKKKKIKKPLAGIISEFIQTIKERKFNKLGKS